MKVVIIWWTSGFGKWLANYIKNHFDVDITVTWTNEEKWKKVANELNVDFTTDSKSAVSEADIVVFSTPISKMESVIKQVGPFINPNAVVADVCSIKWFVTDALKKYSASKLIIPTHPMFGPYVTSIAEQIFVFTPEESVKNTTQYKWFKNYLIENWAKVIETTPTYHDKMMAVVQWLTHINMFTIGDTLRRLNIPVEETLQFVSPIYKLLISSVARYVWHDPKLYGDIQMYNPQVLVVHKKFMEVINDFSQAVETKNEDKFIELIQATKDFFGEKNCEFGQKYTDKLIYFVASQRKLAQNSIWKKLKFTNIYTDESFVDVIDKIEDDVLYLQSGKKLNMNEYVLGL